MLFFMFFSFFFIFWGICLMEIVGSFMSGSDLCLMYFLSVVFVVVFNLFIMWFFFVMVMIFLLFGCMVMDSDLLLDVFLFDFDVSWLLVGNFFFFLEELFFFFWSFLMIWSLLNFFFKYLLFIWNMNYEDD